MNCSFEMLNKKSIQILFSPDLVIIEALVALIKRDKATDESRKMDC